LKSKLLIYVLIQSRPLEAAIAQLLPPKRYDVKVLPESSEFIRLVQHGAQTVDCLVLESSAEIISTFNALATHSILLPAVVIQPDARLSSDIQPTNRDTPSPSNANGPTDNRSISHEGTYLETDGSYHSAVIGLSLEHLAQLPAVIDHSIVQFLKLSVDASIPPKAMRLDHEFQQEGQRALRQKQQNLSKKLNERLGYVGVYYKRDSTNFLRHMDADEKKTFLSALKQDYRAIILGYFSEDSTLNQKIDAYVNTAFLADVPVAQIVEIHMNLMDDFAKQLQIEGRSEEILLDYRLTLIDLLANLCEIYRRAIPRKPTEKS